MNPIDEKQSPFIEKSIRCPVCNKASAQRMFRTRMYLPGEKESDTHVKNYRWMAENATPVHPPFHVLYYCGYCHFVDLKEDFLNPTGDAFHKQFVKAYEEAERRDKLIVELITRHIDYDNIDLGSALNLHFLAIYQRMLPPENSQDVYKIARLLMRVAWLYRENRPDVHGRLRIPYVDDILKALTEFETGVHKAREQFDPLAEALKTRALELDPKFAESGETNLYSLSRAAFIGRLGEILSEIHRLKTLTERDLEGKLFLQEEQEVEPFFTFSSYEAFFEKLKSVWPFAPADEIEAMRDAIVYFQRSINTDPRFGDPQKYASAISLIADLMVRCQDIDGALGMARSIYKTAADNRQHLQKEIQDEELDERTKRRLKAHIERATASIEKAGELRRTLLDALMERDQGKIDRLLAENENASVEELESVLEKNDIAPEIILRLKEKGGPLEQTEKKKRGFFG